MQLTYSYTSSNFETGYFLCVLFILFVPFQSRAQNGSVRQSLSLEKATELFVHNNPRLHQALATSRQTSAEANIPALWPNPSLEFEQERTDAEKQQTLFLSQSILNPVEYSARRRSARFTKKQSQSVYNEQVSQLYLTLRKKYLTALSNAQRVNILENITQTVRKAIHIMKVRQEEGDVGKFQVKRLQTALAQYENRLSKSRVDQQKARYDLWSFIAPSDTLGQIPDKIPYHLTDSLTYQPVHYDPNALVQRAFQQRGLLAAAQTGHKASQMNLRAEKAARLPDLSVSGGLIREPALSPTEAPFLGLGLDIPLWNQNNNQVKAARARVQQTHWQMESARREIRKQVYAAYENVKSSRQKIEQIDQPILQKNKNLMGDALYLYSQGELSLVELLDAASSALDARMLHVNLLEQFMLNRYKLEQSIGQLPPKLR